MLPNVTLPPQPIITRWGTWLEAASFYAKHYLQFKNVVNNFVPESAGSISTCQNLFQKQEIIAQLTHINTNFSTLPEVIQRLESRNIPLCESIDMVDRLKNTLASDNSSVGKKIYAKFVETF